MTEPRANQREFTRVPVCARTVIRAGDRVLAGAPSYSVSMKGMSVRTEERLPLGTECRLALVLVEGEAEIQADGTVVAHLPDGMAFVFNSILGLESFEHLRNLVYFNAPDVEQVESEFTAHVGIRKREDPPGKRPPGV
jgi:hypothetical protein